MLSACIAALCIHTPFFLFFSVLPALGGGMLHVACERQKAIGLIHDVDQTRGPLAVLQLNI
jgi:hypothetical protein